MRRQERAQTSIDFAIAMGVFLVALTTVVAFMPAMNQPFTDAQDDPLTADRIAAQLTDDYLGEPSSPSVLNSTCTMHFFNESPNPSGTDPCRAFVHDDSLNQKLGIDSDIFVNVSLRRNDTGNAAPDIVCATPKGKSIKKLANCGGAIPMTLGPEPPNSAGSVTVARRLALLRDEQVYVVVQVWT